MLRPYALLLLPLLLGCSTPESAPRPASPAGPEPRRTATPGEPAAPERIDIRGVVTSIQRAGAGGDRIGTVLIEGIREPDTTQDKASVTVTSSTRIWRREGSGRRAATFDDIAVGSRVEARFEGPVRESYPVQATAGEVTILAEAARPAPAGTPAVSGWTAGLSEKARPDGYPALLRSVRAASQEGFDRVVFEFEGTTLPGYQVEYVDKPVRQCGSGDAVEVAGDGWLEVRLTPAQAHTEAGEATVEERERSLTLPVLRELESTCDFEAHVTWVLGVASPNRYRVLELSSPARLVIDIQH